MCASPNRAAQPAHERPVHILVISDDGVSTMFDGDERGNSGWDVAATALERARGGGTFVLNLPYGWDGRDGTAANGRTSAGRILP